MRRALTTIAWALVLAAVAFVTLVVVSTPADAGVEMVRMPGSTKSIPMPDARTLSKVERLVVSGEAPQMVLLSPAEMNRKCRLGGYLLGCAPSLQCSLGIVYVRKGMDRALTRMAYQHEVAHCALGWEHP